MTNHDEAVVVEQASPAHCVALARKAILAALTELRSPNPDLGHVGFELQSAAAWLPSHLENEWDDTMAAWLFKYNEHLRERNK